MSDTLPAKFEDLGVEELRRSAMEDFAVEVSPKDGKKVVIAALVEAGVGWSDYVAQHPEVRPQAENVVTSPSVPGESTQKPKPKPEGRIITATRPEVQPEDKFLIKMTRQNPRFDARGYKFTQEHPYALVDAKDARYFLEYEDGFRQAYPSELAEFYG